MNKIQKESDFKLQIYFPGFVDNEIRSFEMEFYTKSNNKRRVAYTKEGEWINCDRCTGGVIAKFKKPEFREGVLMADLRIEYIDPLMPEGINCFADTITSEIQIVATDSDYVKAPKNAPVGIPSYNTVSTNLYPVVVVMTPLGPKGDKGEKGDTGPMPSYDFTLLTEQPTTDISFSRNGSKRPLYCQSFVLTEVVKNQVMTLKGVNTTSAVVRVEGVVFNDDQGDVYQQFAIAPCLAFTGVKASPFYYLQIDTTPFSHLWNPKVYLTVFFTKM